jgi:DNA-binding SARP family transcriptional activator/Tfp pilus assembly protein PilF
MEFAVLGPVTVRRDGRLVAVRSGMLRAVLAALLLEAGRPVSIDRLIAVLWGDQPPASATTSLYNHVMRLRRALSADADRIAAVSKGYVIEVRPAELDLETFTTLSARARAARRNEDWSAVSGELTRALTLWRGEPLSDVADGGAFDAERHHLAELRLQALTWRIEAELRTGDHHEAIAELATLTREHPLREDFQGQLMRALYNAGRQAEALSVYIRLRDALARELGVEPSTALRELHQRILTADPALAVAEATAKAATLVPAQLPTDIFDFAGRQKQLEQFDGVVCGVHAITGQGGIGKTALAVHVAHRLRAHAPDGQLYVDLRGSSAHPLAPADVLAGLLRDLGVAGDELPADEAERAALYRSLLSDRQVLLLFDDAHDAAQLRPLLPGTASCVVLTTSRNRLSGLASWRHLDLDVLDAGESLDLLADIAGRQRIQLEPEAAADVVAACAGLPLAIRIAGSRLRARPAWTLRHLADRISVQEQRLQELQTDDLAVRASFAMSYTSLLRRSGPHDADLARAFRLLGLWTGQDISAPAAASLIGEPLESAELAFEALVDVHLLNAPAPGRYQLHDLLRLYAAERAATDTDAADRDAALTRLLAWYLATAAAAGNALSPGREQVDTDPLQPASQPLAFADRPAAQDWCEQERANLLSAVKQASASGRHRIAWQLTAALWPFFIQRSHWNDWLAAAEMGLQSARALQDVAAEGRMLRSLGSANARLERYDEGIQVLDRALAVAQTAGDEKGEANALNNLANLYQNRGQNDAAVDCYNQALVIHRTNGHRHLEALTLNNLAYALLHSGRFEEAARHSEESVRINQNDGYRSTEGYSLRTHADILMRLGKTAPAADTYRQALAVVREINDRHEEASILESLGQLLLDIGQADEGVRILRQCHRLLTDLRDPRALVVATLVQSTVK